MTLTGWTFMLVSLGLVVGLNVFCFVRLFARRGDGSPREDA
jgi:hypothetical protein